MRSASTYLTDTLSGSYELTLQADVWRAGQLVFTNIPVLDGSVTWEGEAIVRARASLKVADPYARYLPDNRTDGITPYGHEIHLRVGARLPVGGTEMVSLGWFRVQDIEPAEQYYTDGANWATTGATLDIEALDRISYLDDAKFLAPWQPAGSITAEQALHSLIRGIVPLTHWDATGLEYLVSSTMEVEHERLDAIEQLVSAGSARLSMNGDGALAIRDSAYNPAHSVASFTTNNDGGLLSRTRTVSRDSVYNAVVVTGTNTDSSQAYGVAYDTDPNSPTRWGGPFGYVPTFIESDTVSTSHQARTLARTLLRSVIAGTDRTATLELPPNPLLEVGDIITLTTPRLSATVRVIALTLPLSTQAMNVEVAVTSSALTQNTAEVTRAS